MLIQQGDLMQLTIAQPAIDFEWPETTGNLIELSDRNGKQSHLFFYGIARSQFSSMKLNALTEQYSDLEARELGVDVAIQLPVETVKRTAIRYQVPFPILADIEKVIHSKYGTDSSPSDMLKAMFFRSSKLMRANRDGG